MPMNKVQFPKPNEHKDEAPHIVSWLTKYSNQRAIIDPQAYRRRGLTGPAALRPTLERATVKIISGLGGRWRYNTVRLALAALRCRVPDDGVRNVHPSSVSPSRPEQPRDLVISRPPHTSQRRRPGGRGSSGGGGRGCRSGDSPSRGNGSHAVSFCRRVLTTAE